MSDSNSMPPIQFSDRWKWGSRQAISFLMEQGVDNPDILTLGAGLVDSETLPVEEVGRLIAEICSDPKEGRIALQYGSTPGSLRLRTALLKHLAFLEQCSPAELGISADQLLLTTGSQQFLSLVCEVLFNPGDIAFVAAPTYFVFLGTLAGVGARIIPIRSDEHGMVMEDLNREIAQVAAAGELQRVKLIYLVSDFENPSGICLSAERRQQAVELARKWSRQQRILILEDAAYRELRYSGDAIPSIWSYDTDRQFVLLAQTFSKSFSPGLRVGYGVVPTELVGPLSDRKGNEDFGSAHFNQHLLARALETGIYVRHVDRVRQAYTRKRDAMLAAAERYFSDIPGVSWVHPDGGLYVWMSLPEHISASFDNDLFLHATRQEQVMYVPGSLCYTGPLESRPHHQMRLSFGVLEPALIDEAMQRLAKAVRKFVLKKRGLSQDHIPAAQLLSDMGMPLGETFSRLGYATQADIDRARAVMVNAQSIDLDQTEISVVAVELLPESFARENIICPVSVEDGALVVAVLEHSDYNVLDKLRFMLNREIKAVLASQASILLGIDRAYPPPRD